MTMYLFYKIRACHPGEKRTVDGLPVDSEFTYLCAVFSKVEKEMLESRLSLMRVNFEIEEIVFYGSFTKGAMDDAYSYSDKMLKYMKDPNFLGKTKDETDTLKKWARRI